MEAVKKLGRWPIPEASSDYEFLRKMELIRDGTSIRAALLLFGKNPEPYFPSAFLKMGRFRFPTLIVDDREAHGALLDQLDEAMTCFRERLETVFVISGKPERDVLWECPLSATREVVTNVLCHRDYTGHAHSQIWLYDDRLEIWNAGNLPPSLTPDLLFREHDSTPRNRNIGRDVFGSHFIGKFLLKIVLRICGCPRGSF